MRRGAAAATLSRAAGSPRWGRGPATSVPFFQATFRLAQPAIVYFDAATLAGGPGQRESLRVDARTRIGDVIVEPIVASDEQGIWIERLTPAQ